MAPPSGAQTPPPSAERVKGGGPALAGKRIVVTRPAEQAGKLAGKIEARGGVVVRFPVLAIYDTDRPEALQAAAADIEAFDYAVFVSPNAAEKALGAICARRGWPDHVVACAMGETSARAIAGFGVTRIVTPSSRPLDTAALLERPEFAEDHIGGKRVAIFRGDGGREVLGDTLAARGAQVDRIPCYRRGRPELDAGPLRAQLDRGEVDAVTVTSSEGLRNLLAMVGPASETALKNTPLFVAHQRIAEEARSLGFAHVVVTGPGDAGLLAGLETYFGK